MDFRIRQMCGQDVFAADTIRALAGWNQRPSDWRRLLTHEPNGCFVAVIRERIIGTVTTTRYGDELAWIGMMLVHPEYRSRGVGRLLMTAALDYLHRRSTECIMLDATPAGRPLYEQLGFQAEWSFHRWMRELPQADTQSNASRPGPQPENLNKELMLVQHRELDRLAFGCSRWSYLAQVASDSQVVVANQGFGMRRGGSLASYLGPVTASSPAVAKELIVRLLNKVSEQVFWDVPEPNLPAVELATSLQFQPLRPLLRMRLGSESITGDLSKQFAIADPGTG